jgi:methyltransferase (TIGR00027 family)
MREGRSSRTAAYVGFLRALGDRGLTSAEGFLDPTADALLPSRWARAVDWVTPLVAKLPSRVRERIVAHVDLLVCRSLAIDAELTTTLASGCAQVVILGAGFDDRAHRMSALERAHVFEIDHPATQSDKRDLAARQPRTCRELTYVACDFERDVLAEKLASAGHRKDEPTVWIWEGVTLYLTDDAIRETLDTIAARSAESSTLIVEYHDPKAFARSTLYARTRKVLLALWAEPQIGARSSRAMHDELARAGLHVEKDFGLTEWGVAFANARPKRQPASARLAIAKRDQRSSRSIA